MRDAIPNCIHLPCFTPGTRRCGRAHQRPERISGHSDDLLIIQACNVFPMQIAGISLKLPEVGDDYRIILDTIVDIDEMIIELEIRKAWFNGDRALLD
jgi:phenylacetate-CoA ligase